MTISFRTSFLLAAVAAVALGVAPAGAAAQGPADPAEYVRDFRRCGPDACSLATGKEQGAQATAG